MSDIVKATLGDKLKEMGSDWALTEDSAKAVMRVAADTSINGESSFSVVSHWIYLHLPQIKWNPDCL
jgi:hypothetical protein